MTGGQSVTRRPDEYRLSDQKENVVLWHGSSPLPEVLLSLDLVTRFKMSYCAREQPITQRTDDYRLRDLIENFISWQGSSPLVTQRSDEHRLSSPIDMLSNGREKPVTQRSN